MKKLIIDFFKNFPIFTGFLLLLISCHYTSIKGLTVWHNIPGVFWNIVIIYSIITYIYKDFFLPSIEPEKRQSCTWTLIMTCVIVLTILAKFFA